MKILHINKFFDLRGGAETYVHGLIEHQTQSGHEVHALSTRSPGNLPSPDSGRFVERFDFTRHEGVVQDTRKGLAFVWNREAKRATEQALRDFRPDVVHLHNIYHHLSSSILEPIRRLRVPCVQTLHDYKLACPNYKMFTEGSPCERCKGGRYSEAIKHHCLSAGAAENILAAVEMGMTKLAQSYERTVRLFLCPSQFMAEKMAAWGEPPSKLRAIQYPVDIPEDQASCEGSYILVAGRLSFEKGLETLIRAAARVPECEIRLAGTGPEESRLRTLVTSLGAKNVTFLGFLRQPELKKLRDAAAAVALPSIWYDNLPYAALEAAAAGLPLLVSRIGGLPEIVSHEENGLLVTPQDVDAWTDALRRFLAMPPEARKRMGEKSRERILKINRWETHLKALEEIYREIGD